MQIIQRSIKAGAAPDQSDLGTGWGPERQLTAGKGAEKTKHDFRCPICRSAQSLCGRLGETECKWNSRQGCYSRHCSSQSGQGKGSAEGEKCSFKRYFQ